MSRAQDKARLIRELKASEIIELDRGGFRWAVLSGSLTWSDSWYHEGSYAYHGRYLLCRTAAVVLASVADGQSYTIPEDEPWIEEELAREVARVSRGNATLETAESVRDALAGLNPDYDAETIREFEELLALLAHGEGAC